MSKDKRKYSSEIVDGVEQAPSRAMLRAVGFESEDFEKPQGKWLLIFFSSDTCNSCNNVRSLINDLTDDSFHIQEIEFPKRKDLHQRYGINSVPIVLIANEEGVVIWSFAGVPPSDLISDVVSSL